MPSQSLNFDVAGTPIPQGSMVSNGRGRGLRYSNDKKLKEWRHLLIEEMRRLKPDDWNADGVLTVSAVFRFKRPRSHFGTGRNSAQLKPTAPEFHTVKPDADKLTRATGDSVEASGLCKGDQQIVSWNICKRWAIGDEPPGVLLTITTVTP